MCCAVKVKPKVRTEFPNVWGEQKPCMAIPTIHSATILCDMIEKARAGEAGDAPTTHVKYITTAVG